MPVFNSQYSAQYDRLYAQKDYRQECDLIEQAVARYASARPSTILDVGCGTGQHALELAKRGYRLTGVDLSESMLAEARVKSEKLDSASQPRWVQGDARSFSVDAQFDMAVMMFAVIGYLTDNASVLAGLRNIRLHLRAGALLACDFWYGPSVLSDRPTDRVRVLPTETGEIVRTTQTTLDIVNHTADVRFQLWEIAQGRLASTAAETHRMRYFFPQEFALFLSLSGFEMINISAFPAIDTPLTDSAWNAFVVARAV